MPSDSQERYRQAAEDALQQLDWCIGNLGELSEGDTVVVRLRGAPPNVLLLDRRNFERYRVGLRFAFLGGRRLRSPVRLRVPHDVIGSSRGTWAADQDVPEAPSASCPPMAKKDTWR